MNPWNYEGSKLNEANGQLVSTEELDTAQAWATEETCSLEWRICLVEGQTVARPKANDL